MSSPLSNGIGMGLLFDQPRRGDCTLVGSDMASTEKTCEPAIAAAARD